MTPELELQLLLLQNPELRILQQKLDEETKHLSPYAKSLYLQELMFDNVAFMKAKLTELKELLR